MKAPFALILILLSGSAMAAADKLPSDLAEMASTAKLEGPIAAWCKGEFRPGRKGAYAVAITTSNAGGRFRILEADGGNFRLAAYSGKPDLSCYSRADARKLNQTIQRSETIKGKIEPISSTTVLCGFVDSTHAVCWQYSPAKRSFVEVGDWVT